MKFPLEKSLLAGIGARVLKKSVDCQKIGNAKYERMSVSWIKTSSRLFVPFYTKATAKPIRPLSMSLWFFCLLWVVFLADSGQPVFKHHKGLADKTLTILLQNQNGRLLPIGIDRGNFDLHHGG